ncbi:MAG: hypothetical protein ACREDY_14615, partial [Bradyrhizobium sp.]
YTDALVELPGDAVRAALRRWPREHKFWPALAEIEDEVRGLVGERLMARDAVRRYRKPGERTQPEPIEPTDEEREAVSAKLRAAGIPENAPTRGALPEAPPPDLRKRINAVHEETKRFRLPSEDDPMVKRILEEMGP